MNNSINYGNFIPMIIKRIDIGTLDANSEKPIKKGNRTHRDKIEELEHISGMEKWLGE